MQPLRYVRITLEKAFEPQISQKNADYQGLAEFKALTLRVYCNEA